MMSRLQNQTLAEQGTRDCFAEPAIGPAKGRTRWLAMTAEGVIEQRTLSLRGARSATKQSPLPGWAVPFWRNEPEDSFWQNEPEVFGGRMTSSSIRCITKTD